MKRSIAIVISLFVALNATGVQVYAQEASQQVESITTETVETVEERRAEETEATGETEATEEMEATEETEATEEAIEEEGGAVEETEVIEEAPATELLNVTETPETQETEMSGEEVEESASETKDALSEEVQADGESLPDDPGYLKYLEQQGAQRLEGWSSRWLGMGEGYIHNSRFANCTIHNGIDVSYYQGYIDWQAVKNSGVEFVFVRLGYRGYGGGGLAEDRNRAAYLSGALNAGLKVGAYFFSQAITPEEAIQEANYAMSLAAGYNLTLPLVIDYEYAYYSNGAPGRLAAAGLDAGAMTNIVNAFCNTVQNGGYDPMVYANKNMLTNSLYANQIQGKVWLANYTTQTSYGGDYQFWQYSSNGTVNGISGRVDCNFWYDDSDVENFTRTIEDGIYTIATEADGNMRLDVANASVDNGGNLELWSRNYRSAQDFKITYLGDGKYSIMALCSGKYLDVENGGTADGTNVVQYLWNGGDNQKWYIKDNGDGTYTIISVASGKALDVANGTATDGANVLLWTRNGGTNQKFRFNRTSYQKTLSNGTYVISAESNDNLVFDVAGESMENSADIGLWEKKGGNNQKFQIRYIGNGMYSIKAKHSGKYMDAERGGSSVGTRILQYDRNDGDNQKWYLKETGNGTYSIVSSNGLYVESAGGNVGMGSNLQLGAGSGETSQRFSFTRIYENSASDDVKNGWYYENGKRYWYDNGVMARDKEVYDPDSDAWYWFDADGIMATNKDVFIPENEERTEGKWVRYDSEGGMIKGEDYRYGGWYWFEPVTGEMIKGFVFIPEEGSDGKWVYYDETNGQMHHGESCINGNWYYFDDWTGKMIHGEYRRNGNWYYYDSVTGIMAHGWTTLPDGRRIYYDDVTGIRA